MERDEVMALLEQMGGVRGETCYGANFDRSGGMRFRLCCGSDTPEYPHRDYAARGPRVVVVYLSLNRQTGLITCGPKGVHHVTGTEPCV